MKRVEYSEEKRQILLKQRGIDLEIVADMITKGKIKDILPNKIHTNQRNYLIKYNNYPVEVPFVEDENKIFIKTAFQNRKRKCLFNI